MGERERFSRRRVAPPAKHQEDENANGTDALVEAVRSWSEEPVPENSSAGILGLKTCRVEVGPTGPLRMGSEGGRALASPPTTEELERLELLEKQLPNTGLDRELTDTVLELIRRRAEQLLQERPGSPRLEKLAGIRRELTVPTLMSILPPLTRSADLPPADQFKSLRHYSATAPERPARIRQLSLGKVLLLATVAPLFKSGGCWSPMLEPGRLLRQISASRSSES